MEDPANRLFVSDKPHYLWSATTPRMVAGDDDDLEFDSEIDDEDDEFDDEDDDDDDFFDDDLDEDEDEVEEEEA